MYLHFTLPRIYFLNPIGNRKYYKKSMNLKKFNYPDGLMDKQFTIHYNIQYDIFFKTIK